MPKPIQANIKIDPIALEGKQELASKIAVICTQWTEIENEIIMIYAVAVGMDPALAAMALGRVNSLPARLDIVGDALKHAISIEAGKKFHSFMNEIRKCAGLRSDVVHCVWTTHDDYPNHLIRVRGLADPKLLMTAYDLKDFAEILLRLARLHAALREFLESLPAERQRGSPKLSAWKSVVRSPDPET